MFNGLPVDDPTDRSVSNRLEQIKRWFFKEEAKSAKATGINETDEPFRELVRTMIQLHEVSLWFGFPSLGLIFPNLERC